MANVFERRRLPLGMDVRPPTSHAVISQFGLSLGLDVPDLHFVVEPYTNNVCTGSLMLLP